MTYRVTVRPVILGGKRYGVGETIHVDEKDAVAVQLVQDGYLVKTREKKDGKKTD